MKLINFIFIFTLFSCSLFLPELDQSIPNANSIIPTKQEINFCSQNTKLELISKNLNTQESFQKFLTLVQRNNSVNATETFILWSFFQINTRPDLSSPTAKFTTLINNGQNNSFFLEVSSITEELSFPMIHGLDLILKESKSKRNLIQLAELYDLFAPSNFKISNEFSNVLAQVKDSILAGPNKEIFTRGGEILQQGETIPKTSMVSLIRKYFKINNSNNFKINRNLFEYKNSNINEKIKCNYDFKLYDSSIYLINENFININMFGLKLNNHKFFALTNQSKLNPQKISFIPDTFYFISDSKVQSPALCEFSKEGQLTWLFSENSRDPGQHLYHLIKIGLSNIKDYSSLNSFLNSSRHLILRNPLRMIFESQRASKEQLDQLLKLNIPTYNAETLGNIWAYFESKNIDGHFFYDTRNLGNITCH